MRRCIALILLTIVTAAGCTAGPAPDHAATGTSAPAAANNCPSSVTPRPLPAWARAGFQPPTTPMPYVMGDRGDIVAILWADPPHAPPLATVNNKILWVAKMASGTFTPLRIRATLDATGQTATRHVAGGPGPSIIDLPGRRLLVPQPELVRPSRSPHPALRPQLVTPAPPVPNPWT